MEVIIDKKKYVIIPEKEYRKLKKKATAVEDKEELLSFEEAKAYSLKLINEWSKEGLK